jgi:hypothetical protein
MRGWAIGWLTCWVLPVLAAPGWHLRCDQAAAEAPAQLVVVGAGQVRTSDQVPLPWLYEPAAQKARANGTSWLLQPTKADRGYFTVPATLPAAGSFTLEVLARPARDPQRPMWAIHKIRRSPQAAELHLGVRHLRNARQSYFGASVTTGTERHEWSTGSYTTDSRLHDEPRWHHLALVYDAPAQTLTAYLDHWQAATHRLAAPLNFDDGPWHLGGGPDDLGWDGHLDEPRLTLAALTPGQFLRSVPVALAGVDFARPLAHFPADAGVIDVRSGFGAVGDGQTDDTAALQRAFATLPNKIPLNHYTLHLPAGTYLVRDLCWCSRFFTVQGAGPDKTIIKLADNSPGYGDPSKPRPVVRASSTRGDPGSNKGVNGSSIELNLFDLTIDTGTGNPGAKALEYHSNNIGALVNVGLRSGDGAGVLGLDLTHHDVGPCLIKNVTVDGFDVGVATRYGEYSVTFEKLTLRRQRTAGIRNEGNILAIRQLTSTNRVPALLNNGAGSLAVVLDSQLTGGAADAPAIVNAGGLFARNVRVADYGTNVRGATPPPAGDLTEYVSGPVIAPRGGAKSSLHLPIEEAPDWLWGDVSRDWVNVQKFADRKRGDDWAPALQAALDSGAKTVYLPQGHYELHTPVTIRSSVRVLGLHSGLRRPKSDPSTQPVVIVAAPADALVCLERCNIGALAHHGPGPLVVRHGGVSHYSNAAGCGKLFLEDIGGADWKFAHPQQVWARQWNVEAHGPGPCIVSQGATLWCLGFKTEYESAKLVASGGAKTEILGGLVYPVNKGIPKDRPVFANTDSSLALVYGLSVYSAAHDLQVRDTHAGQTTETRLSDCARVGARFRVDLFVSRP